MNDSNGNIILPLLCISLEVTDISVLNYNQVSLRLMLISFTSSENPTKYKFV